MATYSPKKAVLTWTGWRRFNSRLIKYGVRYQNDFGRMEIGIPIHHKDNQLLSLKHSSMMLKDCCCMDYAYTNAQNIYRQSLIYRSKYLVV